MFHKFVHNSIALLFLTALTLQSFYKYFWIADYYINKSAYIENCINKSKPKLKCNGHCQLSKKVNSDKNSQSDQSEPSYKKNLLSDTFFKAGKSCCKSSSLFLSCSNEIKNGRSQHLFNQSLIKTLFHPPSTL